VHSRHEYYVAAQIYAHTTTELAAILGLAHTLPVSPPHRKHGAAEVDKLSLLMKAETDQKHYITSLRAMSALGDSSSTRQFLTIICNVCNPVTLGYRLVTFKVLRSV
jgi:hypothetical protein